MKEEALYSLGFNQKEIAIYLANLQLGSALVQEIARVSSLNRTSAYDILASLEKRGLVSYMIKAGKRFYQATDPDQLVEIIKEKESLIKQALPELNRIKRSITKKPVVEVYVGKNGLKPIFNDILDNSTSFLCLASKKHLMRIFKYYLPHFVNQRIKKKIKVKIISDSKPLDYKAPYKIIKKNIKTAYWVYNGKVAMISLEDKEPVGILIEEENMYKTQKMMFEALWENLSK